MDLLYNLLSAAVAEADAVAPIYIQHILESLFLTKIYIVSF